MAKRWINSADVEVSAAGALLTEAGGFPGLAGGTKTVAAAATPEKLVAAATPCRMVWVGAPIDAATGLKAGRGVAAAGDGISARGRIGRAGRIRGRRCKARSGERHRDCPRSRITATPALRRQKQLKEQRPNPIPRRSAAPSEPTSTGSAVELRVRG